MILAVLLTVADPQGDTRGDGSYVLPVALSGPLARSLDLRDFRAEGVGGKLRLTVGMGGLDNPWNAPLGFSAAMVDVFVKTDYGGARALGDSANDLQTPPGEGWQHRYTVTGFGTRAYLADKDGKVRADAGVPRVRTEGSSIVLDTDLPTGRYSYWVTSRVYSPLTQGGALSPREGGGGEALSAPRAGMPQAVDVLYGGDQARAYASRVLYATGELRDRRPLALLALAGAGLLLAAFATLRAWRRV